MCAPFSYGFAPHPLALPLGELSPVRTLVTKRALSVTAYAVPPLPKGEARNYVIHIITGRSFSN